MLGTTKKGGKVFNFERTQKRNWFRQSLRWSQLPNTGWDFESFHTRKRNYQRKKQLRSRRKLSVLLVRSHIVIYSLLLTFNVKQPESGDMRAIEVSHKITSSYQSSDSMRNHEERAKIAGNHWLRFDSKKFDSVIESNHEVILSNLRLYKILSERLTSL